MINENRSENRETEKICTEVSAHEELHYYLEYLDWKRQQDEYLAEEPEDDGIVYNVDWFLNDAKKRLASLNKCERTKDEIVRELGEIIYDLSAAGADLTEDSESFTTASCVLHAYIDHLQDIYGGSDVDDFDDPEYECPFE